jgi:hypothetical protein
MRIVCTLFVVFIVVGCGCGTFSIGRPPSDLDLKNDGTPEAQRALDEKYRLTFRQGYLERPGVTVEFVEAETGLDVEQVITPSWSDEAAEHFGMSVAAFEATDTALVGFDRFANSGTPPLILQAGGVLIGTTVGAALAITNPLITAPPAGAADQLAYVSNSAFTGAFAGLLISMPLVVVYDWTVPALSAALSASDYRRGVKAYNQDLAKRIEQGAPPPSPAPVSAPVPPLPPPPPTSDEPPAPIGDLPTSG